MAIKLDLANAFDRLRHDFIFLVLEKFGFPPIFVKQIQACISSPWIAPLVNGRPSEFFKPKRGIRHGCPLSPFLYILVADCMSRRLNNQLEEEMIPGLSFKIGIQPINHALFVDDSILLARASTQIARIFQKYIDFFLLSSGSKVNLDKCQIYGWHSNVNTLRDISQILNMKFNYNWMHFNYLGTPITKKSFSSAMWRPVIQKIITKILFLGTRWLNIAGKSTLI